MKRFLTILCGCAGLLLTGCNDLRTRRYAAILAVREGTAYAATLRCDGEETWYRASAETPDLLPTALEAELGARLSMGHLGLLVLQGERLTPLTALLDAGQLVPTCPVLLCKGSTSAQHLAERTAQLQIAQETGLLPRRTAGDIYGDLQSAAHMTLLPYLDGDVLTLAVSDGVQTCAVLSEDACRGAALLCGRWDCFSFAEKRGNTFETIRLSDCGCKLRMEQTAEGLILTAELSPQIASGDGELARTAICRMVRAYFQEAVIECAADACFLEETALRCGIPVPDTDAWRALLCGAELRITAT